MLAAPSDIPLSFIMMNVGLLILAQVRGRQSH